MRALLSYFSVSLREIISKVTPLLKFEIIGTFANTMTADYRCPVPDSICRSLFKSNYLKKENHFLIFFFYLWNLHQIFNILKQKKIVIANVFSKLQTVKDLVRPLSKKRCFRTFFESQHVKSCQTLVKSALAHFYYIFSSFWRKMTREKSLLFKFEIVGLFVNTFTSDYKYPVPDSKNFQVAIQIQLP